MSLHPACFSTVAQVVEGAALRLAVQHERSRRSTKRARTVAEVQRDVLHVVRENLRRNVWPEPLAENIGVDYPDAKRTNGLAGLDKWARAGFCHGVLDVVAAEGPRQKHAGASAEQWQVYTLAYMGGRMAMTGVDA